VTLFFGLASTVQQIDPIQVESLLKMQRAGFATEWRPVLPLSRGSLARLTLEVAQELLANECRYAYQIARNKGFVRELLPIISSLAPELREQRVEPPDLTRSLSGWSKRNGLRVLMMKGTVPDIPENHRLYEAVANLGREGLDRGVKRRLLHGAHPVSIDGFTTVTFLAVLSLEEATAECERMADAKRARALLNVIPDLTLLVDLCEPRMDSLELDDQRVSADMKSLPERLKAVAERSPH
jgi:hypothetical protein